MPNLDTPELVFLPLGGCGEIGMNLNAYGYGPAHDRKWILVDLGVTFGDDSTPGIDLICADPEFLEDQADNIEAIFLTHAHEDHIGAVGLLWPRLRAPLYATPFTAHLVAGKLAERGLSHVDVNVVPLEGEVEAGPFTVTYITLTHSIPEPNALAIKTPSGTILHTGDWKIDPDPLIGEGVDVEGLKKLGDEGVLAMVCDSTNVFVNGESGSEATVRGNLIELIGSLKGRVAVATFASNVARVATVIEAARKAGRSVCLAGRSMHKIVDAAVQTGVLKDLPDLVDEADAGSFPASNILYLCTGSQGEERAALGRIANGTHRHLTLGEGDTAIFSSRVIPGNEKGIFDMQNALAERGVRIITDRMTPDPIHVSGHPARDELERMYQWVRPRIAVPVHGERRHIVEHAAFARSMQVAEAVTPRNGDMIRLWPGKAEAIDVVPNGRLYLDGSRLVPAGAEGLGERIAISKYGYVTASVALDEDGSIADGPYLTSRGLSEEDGSLADESLDEVEAACDEALDGLSRRKRLDDDTVEAVLVRAIRRSCERVFGRKPLVDVTIMRV
ncbi:ribonuclease J [Henriciella mobilis]|uniref:ribonuclease J n=1 Tax=Henriciella mobilis TaxID=2305467 RepID=UPI000E662EF9|nr:ribonuclease J [Henriciella mobilis]RIJ15465.1 ribonuclease J [Henriciella mobilis]RIJ18929.1 ribonuclease J [Henriciella mobilis]